MVAVIGVMGEGYLVNREISGLEEVKIELNGCGVIRPPFAIHPRNMLKKTPKTSCYASASRRPAAQRRKSLVQRGKFTV